MTPNYQENAFRPQAEAKNYTDEQMGAIRDAVGAIEGLATQLLSSELDENELEKIKKQYQDTIKKLCQTAKLSKQEALEEVYKRINVSSEAIDELRKIGEMMVI